MTFNLVDEAWVPVERGGRQTLVSLREALTSAHAIDGLAPPRAALVPALLRQVLLPAVIDACGIPRSGDDWAKRWRGGRFEAAAIQTYLNEHRHRFDLFDPEHPFAQVADLQTARGDTKPSSRLIPSIAVGNNVPLFTARTESEPPPLAPSEAALWLVHTHCWDTAAIKTGAVDDPRVKGGKTTGNPTGPLGQLGVVVPIGSTLFETLLLNIPVRPDGLPPADRPQWRAEPAGPKWTERSPLGLLDLFTWQARRVRLFPSQNSEGPTVVREVIVTAGDRLDPDPDLEPHTAWSLDPKPKKGRPSRRPRRLRPGRNAWQGLDGLLAVEPPADGTMETSSLLRQAGDLLDVIGEGYPLSVLTVGVIYGSQQAVVDHVVVDEIPLPVAALRGDVDLRERLQSVVEQGELLARALNDLHADVRRAMGGEPIPWDRGQRPGVELVYILDQYVRRMLAGLQREPHRHEEADRAWQQVAFRHVMRLADRLLDDLPPSAFAGRLDLARNRTYRPANAERVFRRRIRAALPESFGPPSEQEASLR